MKAIGVVGFKESGKTTLATQLAQELEKRGYHVTTVKHAPEGIDILDKDTSKHKKAVHSAIAISDNESAIFLRGKHSLDDMLTYLQADYVVIEGFKKEKTFPKILCIKYKDDVAKLTDGLEIAAVGEISDLAVPVMTDIKKLCDLVEQKAFKLPKLDCGECGFATCYELGREIVRGKKRISDCPALTPKIKIKIDDTILPLNKFAEEIIRTTIKGMLSSLKGYRQGRIRIEIPRA